jgi:DNA invertase Pin-like site-specific DNA recombinase
MGRSHSDLVKIIGDLERDGITFESLSEKIDTGSASGKLQFHVFAALAEFERNLIRERTMAGWVGENPSSMKNRYGKSKHFWLTPPLG